MPKIPNTFCPAKWEELVLSFEYSYAYACCKSTPKKVNENVMEFIDKEKLNLLSGIQDPSCDFCWKVENSGGKSRRQEYLDKFDADTFDQYINDTAPLMAVEVNLGNECNFQCVYCNPKFSSKWEADVTKKSYAMFTDRFVYDIDHKQKNVQDKNIEFLKSCKKFHAMTIIGGEPLLNKKFFELIDTIPSKQLVLSTNLSAKKEILDRLIAKSANYEEVLIHVSLDATKEISEFVRYGLDYDQLMQNLHYLINTTPPNVKIVIGSLLTSITIRDFANFSKVIVPLLSDKVRWDLNYCQLPKTQSMLTLSDEHKPAIIEALVSVEHLDIRGLSAVKTVVENTKFNKTMFQEMKHFYNEFSKRKGITIPISL